MFGTTEFIFVTGRPLHFSFSALIYSPSVLQVECVCILFVWACVDAWVEFGWVSSCKQCGFLQETPGEQLVTLEKCTEMFHLKTWQ